MRDVESHQALKKGGSIIGHKGWVIKKIVQDSGAQVSINQSVKEGADRQVIISGRPEAVGVACR